MAEHDNLQGVHWCKLPTGRGSETCSNVNGELALCNMRIHVIRPAPIAFSDNNQWELTHQWRSSKIQILDLVIWRSRFKVSSGGWAFQRIKVEVKTVRWAFNSFWAVALTSPYEGN
ncbi:hypothetical protein BD769DRAFT_1388845 [Suillus cothurnatus]|nr:hypothetical protein BD769DRAFT_1388845 [Suillus cothurnatus]